MMQFVQIKSFCLTFLRKMAQIFIRDKINPQKLNVMKGTFAMNKTEFVEAIAKTSKLTKADSSL